MSFQLLDGEKGDVTHPAEDVFEIYTEVLIDAPPEKVWAVLTDFDKLSEWSNNLVGLEGDFRDGGQITVYFKAGPFTQELKHEVKFFEEGRSFGWSDPLFSGLSDRHVYQVNATDDGKTLFVQTDQVKGVHGHIGYHIGQQLANGTMHSYVEFNRRLKARVEAI
ncbi:MAG: SRPBCC domain-containing protein [Chloroflexota bacterium]